MEATASRFHARHRAASYLDREPDGPEDSSGDSDPNQRRQKFQRATTDPDTSESTFRKPSLPASASRHITASNSESRPSFRENVRTLRENVRVPSGPREMFPSPVKQRMGSTSSLTPSITDSTNVNRTYLPPPNVDSFFYNSAMASSQTRLKFADPTDEADSDSPVSFTGKGGADGADFLPDVNFDDFQTSIKNYDGTSPLLSDFPAVHGGRVLPKEHGYGMARSNGFASTTKPSGQHQQKDSVGRAQSLRQRLASGRQASASSQPAAKEVVATQPATSSLRGRRQSSLPQSAATTIPAPSAAAVKPPRKSVGPGLLTSMMSKASQQSTSPGPADSSLKPAIARNTSLSKARRTTLQPAASAGAELPRLSTLTATTQSRQNKVKSLQPPPREPQDPTTTPSSIKTGSKSNHNRAHTPSSSGNRRQSIVSGRASGLGARTISPTDARRLKRMSMMNPPPMPTANLPKGTTPTPQDEIPDPMPSRLPDLPRLAQPSPSMIPRKVNNATPSSARASPEARYDGGVSLKTKSSYQSLINNSLNGSTSRLPTPKVRSGMQSGSAMGQYGEQYGEQDQEELVPPVPAIPKAYESPKDLDSQPPFFSSSMLRSSQLGFSDSSLMDTPAVPTPWATSQTPRTSVDIPSETPRKQSTEFGRLGHRRTNTNNGSATIPAPSAPPKSTRAQPDPNGRRNNNLQPLRLPPLNLMPILTRSPHSNASITSLPRPSQEIDNRDESSTYYTPEPKRTAKTPSTPMTASKATFFRRGTDEQSKALRSASSHYALRDFSGIDHDAHLMTKFWDDSDVENAGVPIPNANKGRNAITPFASGSLPKGSGEFARYKKTQSGYYEEEDPTYDSLQMQIQAAKPQGARTRALTGTTIASFKSSIGGGDETPLGEESPAEPASGTEAKKDTAEKKDTSTQSALRRRLSLGWRRSSSKTANHPDNKSSPLEPASEKDKDRARLQKYKGNDMPPPKLPASATWSGEVPSLPNSSRPSFEQPRLHARRPSQVPTSISTTSLVAEPNHELGTSHVANMSVTSLKTKSQHTEQPTPVTASSAATARASSWGNLGSALRGAGTSKPASASRHKLTPSTLSAIVKDKDDLAADDEMARLSRKRKDVDSAARQSEELYKRAVPRSPATTEHVLHDRSLTGGSTLNVFERGEIVDYEKDGIYFTGTKSARKVIGSLTPSPLPTSADSADKNSGNNFGYDDERGDYNIILGDHLAYRYEVVDVLGKGSFGQVVRCVDHKDGGVVAVKIIRNKKRFHQQALVEVGILGKLRDWDPDGAHATLSITSSFYFRAHLCIVTPCLSINLYELIRSHNFVGFSLPLIRRFARQLLACLTLLQTKHIIHCDLKPENILLCEARKADVRVIDFGSSCREEEKVYTYIQSRFYRSPEVILGSSYGMGIDMWSLGCILAELWTGYPIFPGENEQEQLACIMEIFGPPDRHLVERCTRKKLFFDSVGKPRVTVSSKGRRRRPSSKTLQQALKTEDEAFIDFISRCLRWDPERRLKPGEAITHPFITNLPFHQRPGIAEEARRARVRTTTAVPAANGQSIPSPVKRTTVGSGTTLAATNPAATPARDRSRVMPETPQTAVRGNITAGTVGGPHGSPVKSTASPNRRHSTVVTTGPAPTTVTKRTTNGAVLGGTLPPVASVQSQHQQQRGTSGNLAQMAAAQSMGAAAANASTSSTVTTSTSRWRA